MFKVDACSTPHAFSKPRNARTYTSSASAQTKMPKARNRINYPELCQVILAFGGMCSQWWEVCISIIGLLGSDGSSGIFQNRNNELKTQKKMYVQAAGKDHPTTQKIARKSTRPTCP
jgi:hypothetical protein